MAADYRTTLQKVHACRDKHETGLELAKRIVQRDELRAAINDAEELNDIKRILLEAFPAMEHSHDY